jgi:hypothetical protein
MPNERRREAIVVRLDQYLDRLHCLSDAASDCVADQDRAQRKGGALHPTEPWIDVSTSCDPVRGLCHTDIGIVLRLPQ